jgi:transcriptional regulator
VYVPADFEMDDAAVRDLLAQHGAGDLITATAGGLLATFLPFVYEPADDGLGSLHGHLARNNEQWRHEPVGDALVLLRGPDSYVTPAWYAAKQDHGRVVPTWNYVSAHVHGQLVVRDELAFVRDVVERLTRHHEAGRDRPWAVADAPAGFIARQLRAIVGVELRITRIEAKAKLSQNRSDADIDGVVAGLRRDGQLAMADAVQRSRPSARPTGPRGR